MDKNDQHFMKVALDLARKGLGRTSPNPCVGAVIVRKGKIVGQGYHRKAGTSHAEVHAIEDAGDQARGATLYVTLEPCNHTGRTPPCTLAILQAGISRVVVGMSDPNPSVTGGGCNFLSENGIMVEKDVLLQECQKINRPFTKHITSGIPWVVIKAGMSLDGKISFSKGQGGRITGNLSARKTHQLRDTLDAILIGVGTALVDNPSLTTRLEEKGDARDPLRVVIDSLLRLPPESSLLLQKSTAQTWIFCSHDAPSDREQQLKQNGAVIHRIQTDRNGRVDLQKVLEFLGKSGIISILVEGGAEIHSSMLRQKLVDEVYLFIAPFFIGKQGVSLLTDIEHSDAERLRLRQIEIQQLEDDTLIHGILAGDPA
jgi:diaminohydroxyphosphoribosylaminopyrimidine deaminase/5-amino-6-(5-phosphoribosylamino)uracil reductase